MSREELERSWAITTEILNRAASKISEPKLLDQFREYLDHNELELAMDELFYLGKEKGLSMEFFMTLKEAAVNMELNERVDEIEAEISRVR
ncbi:hypothetical protein [Microcystis aeruginosa]|jgi:hypothetical protein|uniref:hypothetical protein n=1 Tax=Microcystis aeruginosa TaxID=1126 RepID=UPI0004694748|nr:hypothetical protein [Microcystis aeruginosa]MDB9394509.1 hypothetical protein [Microcystis aeruginosa CS-573]